MKKIITKEKFIKIFENPLYRQKLDKIILNFFGLEANKQIKINANENKSVLLEFIVFVNTEYLLKIIVEDKEELFKENRKFYINISFREVNKYHELLMPCYWEIYSLYSLKYKKNNPQLVLIAALFSCELEEEVRMILNKLNIFNEEEIANIMNTKEEK